MIVNKDPDAVFFKKLEGFQPCEINELKAGTNVFAVYGTLYYTLSLIWCAKSVAKLLRLFATFTGDNFFKSANYTIEVMCAEPFSEEKERLRDVEAKLLTKRVELSKFETEYREVLMLPALVA